MIKAIIIEDENPAALHLLASLDKIAPDVRVLKTIDNVKDAVAWLSQNTVDLIFLDIHIGDGISFSIFESLQIDVPVIFTTAYSQYAIKAFRTNSIDYLLKPFSETELQQAIDKFRLRQHAGAEQIKLLLQELHQTDYQQRFMVVSLQKIKSISTNDVAYFVSDGRYVKLVAKTAEKYLLDESLEALMHKLDPQQFFRINRQFIVGFDSIKQMAIWSKSRVKLELLPAAETEVVVSIDKSGAFKRWLNR